MAESSSIEWTESTWNPSTGCDRVSAGCDNCYALTMAKRLKAMGSEHYQLDGDPRTSGPGFAVQTHLDSLDLPRRWSKPRLIFVNSMSDLFHAKVPISFVRDVFAVMEDTPRHTYQLLTKRSSRLEKMSEKLDWPDNLWVGVSVESADVKNRIEHLRSVPAKTRFVSAEPLLSDLGTLDLDQIDWVIAGGESGRNHRPMDANWARSIRDQCLEQDTAFFFKQWGGLRPKANGRDLDGREWNELPLSLELT